MANLVRKTEHTWLEHVLRMEASRLPLTSLQAHSMAVKKQGGQKERWVDSVLKHSGLNMLRALKLAQDRDGWRSALSWNPRLNKSRSID